VLFARIMFDTDTYTPICRKDTSQRTIVEFGTPNAQTLHKPRRRLPRVTETSLQPSDAAILRRINLAEGFQGSRKYRSSLVTLLMNGSEAQFARK
jgi:hypothetical protein